VRVNGAKKEKESRTQKVRRGPKTRESRLCRLEGAEEHVNIRRGESSREVSSRATGHEKKKASAVRRFIIVGGGEPGEKRDLSDVSL